MPRTTVDPVQLGERELDILAAVWSANQPVSVRDVQEHLEADGHALAYTTVQTMLNRLEAKGMVRRDTTERTHLYAPGLRRTAAVRASIRRIVDRFFGGSAAALATHLIDESVPVAELQRIRERLDRRSRR